MTTSEPPFSPDGRGPVLGPGRSASTSRRISSNSSTATVRTGNSRRRKSSGSADYNNRPTPMDSSGRSWLTLPGAKEIADEVAAGKAAEETKAASEPKEQPGKVKGSEPPNVGTEATAAVSKSSVAPRPLEEQLQYYKDQITQEKLGKRKLFHSLVKLANELRRTREISLALAEQQRFVERSWAEGGIWRAPTVLPGVALTTQQLSENFQQPSSRTVRLSAISLSDLFFSLVTVTAFTRVGVAISEQGYVTPSSLAYFAIFWTVWSKEASYSTRFDTSDLSAKVVTLLTCFAVLFASLSVQSPLGSPEAKRVMIMAAAVAFLHCLLHVRVAWTTRPIEATTAPNAEQQQDEGQVLMESVRQYAYLNLFMNLGEAVMWLAGVLFVPANFRWITVSAAIILALRVPRSYLANDFHAACSKRGVLFILLLGFLLQSVVVVASDFFAYQTPTLEHYFFIGASCLLLFCVKLLYVDDSAGALATDHALLVNRCAAFSFNVGHFCLLLSTTVLGSGLNLLTHSYLAATAALSGPDKSLVCGGFSACLFFTFFIKSMHLKRVPTDPKNQALFVGAYVVQAIVLLVVVAMSGLLGFGALQGNSVASLLMQNDMALMMALSGAALFVVIMSWLDEGVELLLYSSVSESRAFRVEPFGFWWCLTSSDDDQDVEAARHQQVQLSSRLSLGSTPSLSRIANCQSYSQLDPLLGGPSVRLSSYNATSNPKSAAVDSVD